MESRSFKPGHYIRGRREDDEFGRGGDDELTLWNCLHQELYNLKYLIVLDDVWDPSFWDKIQLAFPDKENGSRIIFTSRDERVARNSIFHYVMRPLNEENSWALLREIAGGDDCPPSLEKIGRSIADQCRGLPLLIVGVAYHLFMEVRTEKWWQMVEAQLHDLVTSTDNIYWALLNQSYQYLPSRLKACLLYMAAFQQDTDILVSKLLNLWVAEGFLAQPSPPQTMEQVAKQHLDDLISRSLISVVKLTSDGQPKACRLDYYMMEFVIAKCQQEGFFNDLEKFYRHIMESRELQRHILVQNNILLCSGDVYECTASNKYARTLVYAGPNFHHPMPHFITFELLRVLDALSVYFADLPDSLFQLIHLRYLALTYDGMLPDSLSKLQNLMVLIVRQHPKIIFRLKSILPAVIWNLPQIRHLFFTESFLCYPGDACNNSVFFQNLQSLSNVNADCCTKEILQNMPNLKKLATWVEGADAVVQLHLDELQHLENFKFKVLKPIPGLKIEFQPALAFPKTLRKLSLSGCGFPWEDIEVIAELPDLQVLKLRELAFQGQEWCIYSYAFLQLKFLLLESLDLETLDAQSSHFPRLERLIIRHCYRLEEINADIGFIGSLKLIELVDCSPEAEDSVNAIREEQEDYENEILCVRISSSKE